MVARDKYQYKYRIEPDYVAHKSSSVYQPSILEPLFWTEELRTRWQAEIRNVLLNVGHPEHQLNYEQGGVVEHGRIALHDVHTSEKLGGA